MTEHDDQFRRLIDKWAELAGAGQIICVDELCQEDEEPCSPELVARIRKHINALIASLDSKDKAPAPANSGSGEPISSATSESVSTHDSAALKETHDLVEENLDPLATQTQPTVVRSVDDSTHVYSMSQYNDFVFEAMGGLGEVYRAKQIDSGRDVAVKFLRPDRETEEKQDLFKIECKITAKLEHPGVVPIYGYGMSEEGRPFYAMRFISGDSLRTKIKAFHHNLNKSLPIARGENAVAFRELLSHFISMCKTIAYAHDRGVLHRDIKPQNIMLGGFGETLVVDWGLARSYQRTQAQRKSTGLDTLITETRDKEFSRGIVGTPNYMSPEQADGGLYVGPSTDIYSLGACLYEILTGTLAIQGTNIQTVLNKVRRGDIKPPREVNSSVPRPLAAIAMKATAQESEDRYATALALAEDVERYLADEPVQACRETISARLLRWARRHTSIAQSAAIICIASLVLFTTITAVMVSASGHVRSIKSKSFEAKANLQASKLRDDFATLKRDVLFLADDARITQIAKETAQIDDVTATVDTDLLGAQDFFGAFIRRQDSYMQARLLNKHGVEIVRMERQSPGGPVQPAMAKQKKKDKPYFYKHEPAEVEAGGGAAQARVYLSELDLNMENNQLDFDFPVVRASVAVRDNDEFLGVVVINMHLSRLSRFVSGGTDGHIAKDSTAGDLPSKATHETDIYLVDSEGQFLLHPQEGVGFIHERGVQGCRIDNVYPQLSDFLNKKHSRPEPGEPPIQFLKDMTPKYGLVLRPNVTANETQAESLSRELQSVTSAAVTQYGVERECGKPESARSPLRIHHCYGVLKNVDPSQEQAIRDLDQTKSFDIRPLLVLAPNTNHLVYARRVFIDDEDDNRYLTLVFAEESRQHGRVIQFLNDKLAQFSD